MGSEKAESYFCVFTAISSEPGFEPSLVQVLLLCLDFFFFFYS